MELTIDQVMQQGINAHKLGRLDLAERFYQAILKIQPLHPDANHNLGILAISSNKPDLALSFFKEALKGNSKQDQFWYSYIEALIIEKKYSRAKIAVLDAKRAGVTEEKLDFFSSKFPSGLAHDSQRNLKKSKSFSNRKKTFNANKKKKKVWSSRSEKFGPSKECLDILNKYLKKGLYREAENSARVITKKFPVYPNAWSVLSTLLLKRGASSEALELNLEALNFQIKNPETHHNLGLSFQACGMLEDAMKSMVKAIELRKEYPTAHYNLGNIAQALGRLEHAEKSYAYAIKLKSDYYSAYFNLGNVKQELEKFDEAETCYKKAIKIKPDFADAYFGLGCVLEGLGKINEAEKSYLEAITLKPDFAEALSNLGCILFERGNLDSALNSFERARYFKPELRINELRLKVIKLAIEPKNPAVGRRVFGVAGGSRLNSGFLISERPVEKDLISQIYHMASRSFDLTKDARFGKGECSTNFLMFEEKYEIIKKVSSDLKEIMRHAVQSDVYVYDSFFNIIREGGGSLPHHHVKSIDQQLGLSNQKYSLVYYLSVGDQVCREPGILKLYSPDEDILPRDGMIVIMPASRKHSAVYSGDKDRIMIGVNFYSLEF